MDERPGRDDTGEAREPDEMDEVVTGELVSYEEDVRAVAVGIRLSPLAEDLPGERRQLAVALRRCFVELRISVRGYAARRSYSASSVSRYLSGETVAPDHFVTGLMEDLGSRLGRPMSPEARRRLTSLQRAALKATDTRAWHIQDLEDKLAAALQEADVARTQADAVAVALHAERERAAGLEAERQELAQAVAAHGATEVQLEVLRAEQHRVGDERDALRQRVADLETALEVAERRVARAEQRCAELEQELLAADEAAAAEERHEEQRAQQARERQERELELLRAEVERLRAEEERRHAEVARAQAADAEEREPEVVDGPSVLDTLTRQWADVADQADIAVLHSPADTDIAAAIRQRLLERGLRVTRQALNPRSDISLTAQLRVPLVTTARVILVLSASCFRVSRHPDEEWRAAFSQLTARGNARFAAVHVGAGPLPRVAVGLAAVDGRDVTVDALERELLARLGLPDVGGRGTREADVLRDAPQRNALFTGRASALSAVRAGLRERGLVTVCGMPGVGKTELAIEYLHRFQAEYDAVWWVPAESWTEFQQRLAGEGGRWLVVVDGADEPVSVGGFHAAGRHVLITSRDSWWGIDGGALVPLPVFERQDSVAFLMSRVLGLSETDADQLAEAMGDLPLALDQSARSLTDTGLSVVEYLSLLENTAQHATGSSPDDPDPVTRVYDDLFHHIPGSLPLLGVFAAFSAGSLPRWLLEKVLDDSERYDRALVQLDRYGLASVEPDTAEGAGESLRIPPVVRRLALARLSPEDKRACAEVARQAVLASHPGRPSDPARWRRYAEIVPHLAGTGVLSSAEPGARHLVLDSLTYLRMAGRYGDGVRLAKAAVPAARHWPAPDARELSLRHAALLRAVGDHRRAAGLDREVVKELGTETSEAAFAAVCGLAADLRGLGRYREALGIARGAAARAERRFGQDSEVAVDAPSGLAFSLRLAGEYDGAKDVDRRALNLCRSMLGARHPVTLRQTTSYAIDLRMMGEYAAAGEVLTTNLQDLVALLGPDHPHTLRAERQLALWAYRDQGRKTKDSPFTSLLHLCEDVLGATHPETLAVAMDLSCYDRAEGDVRAASENARDLVDAYRTAYGDDHPFTAGALGNLSLALSATGAHAEALRLGADALTRMTETVGRDHPWTLGCALNVSALRGLDSDPEGAAALSHDTAARAVKTLGRFHPLALSTAIAVAADWRALGRRADAEALERKAVSDLADDLGDEHPRTRAARTRTRPLWDFEPQPS
ncbi:FxSxx-COOH system tetratricopeptide repeat protein [Streptomyces flavalbus]|uniref:FxSxx-COOH system tetratricopeptide repeat protein n=1 Tax=Streptomyces flavalbus TaxID=2665155 RepID=A0ABW2WFT1_9ACTN